VRTVCCDDHTLTKCQPIFDKSDEFSVDRKIVGVHVDGVVVRRSVTHLNIG
jgi:hypothetical protein